MKISLLLLNMVVQIEIFEEEQTILSVVVVWACYVGNHPIDLVANFNQDAVEGKPEEFKESVVNFLFYFYYFSLLIGLLR